MDPDDLANLATVELLEAALEVARSDETDQSDARWCLVRALHARPELAVFERAASWCSSGGVVERTLGADVLAQLGPSTGIGSRPFAAQSVPVLVGLLGDREERVVMSALFALGHLSGGQPTDILPLSIHPSPDVRQAAAYALGGRDDEVSVRTLIFLSRDSDEDVRDWATFGLGSLCGVDSPELREALIARLSDNHPDVRAEAMVGLAERGDLRAAPQILSELRGSDAGELVFEAAERLLNAYPNNEELRRTLSAWRQGTE